MVSHPMGTHEMNNPIATDMSAERLIIGILPEKMRRDQPRDLRDPVICLSVNATVQ
jgi:hypothetical protein